MNFFEHEIVNLMANFPHEAAEINEDFKPKQVAAIHDIGLLKHRSDAYLGGVLLNRLVIHLIYYII